MGFKNIKGDSDKALLVEWSEQRPEFTITGIYRGERDNQYDPNDPSVIVQYTPLAIIEAAEETWFLSQPAVLKQKLSKIAIDADVRIKYLGHTEDPSGFGYHDFDVEVYEDD